VEKSVGNTSLVVDVLTHSERIPGAASRRGISQSIFQRVELQCIVFSPEANRWMYDKENDIAKLLAP